MIYFATLARHMSNAPNPAAPRSRVETRHVNFNDIPDLCRYLVEEGIRRNDLVNPSVHVERPGEKPAYRVLMIVSPGRHFETAQAVASLRRSIADGQEALIVLEWISAAYFVYKVACIDSREALRVSTQDCIRQREDRRNAHVINVVPPGHDPQLAPAPIDCERRLFRQVVQ